MNVSATCAGDGGGAGTGDVGLNGVDVGGVAGRAGPCGLPLTLGCRRLWRLGYRRGAWWAGIALGTITVTASVFAGLLGPVAIAICAVVMSLPAWGAWWWLAHNG